MSGRSPLAEAVGREYISFGVFDTGRLGTGRRRKEGLTMPHYEFYCERCKKEVTLILSIGERERGDYACPGCGGKKLEPRLGTFFSQTSRKA
jgi:putative FmdB family regulatory protein